MELNETEALAVDATERPRPKVGRIPVTLRLLNESETSEAAQDRQASSVARKSDTQFMLLLVTLFVIVNLTLITLLNHKDKPVTAKPAEVATTHTPAPLAATAQPAQAPAAIPAAASKLELPVPAASTPLFNAPPLPAAVTKTPAASAYVTPASANSTRTTSAPIQHVSISEHAVAAPAALAAAPVAGEKLTIVHSEVAAPPAVTAPELAPAAGTPAVSPEAAKQDLLSVINKD